MTKKTFIISSVLTISFFLAGCGNDVTPPKVTNTYPQNGAQDVDPNLTNIWVKFDEPMMDKSWSWAYTNKDQFPELAGTPSYEEGNTKNILPVKLLPNHEYDIWINTENLKNFKDTAGNSATPFELKFKTK